MSSNITKSTNSTLWKYFTKRLSHAFKFIIKYALIIRKLDFKTSHSHEMLHLIHINASYSILQSYVSSVERNLELNIHQLMIVMNSLNRFKVIND